MKCLNNKIKFIYALIICFLLLNFLSVIDVIPILKNIMPTLWIILFIIGIFITKEDYNSYYDVRDKRDTIIIIILVYLMLYFMLGLITGYAYNNYKGMNIWYKLYLYVIPIISQEYIRSILCMYSDNKKKYLIFITIVFILLRIDFSNITLYFTSGESFFKILFLTILPVIFTENLLTYLSKIGGFTLSIVYKLPIVLFNTYIPIFPNIHFLFLGMILITIPVITYLIIDGIYEKETKKLYVNYEKIKLLNYAPSIILIVFIFLNIIGVFKYNIIAILSNSMEPIYSRGDSIIYKELNDTELDELKEGDIIVYDNDGVTYSHRISRVIEDDGTYYITKGDNNTDEDKDRISKEDIKGKYLFKVKYIGFPKVILYEFLIN